MSIEQHDHDDGLVHGHAWAAEPAHLAAAQAPAAASVLVNRPAETEHDDGLVHSHNWASSERSPLAHHRG